MVGRLIRWLVFQRPILEGSAPKKIKNRRNSVTKRAEPSLGDPKKGASSKNANLKLKSKLIDTEQLLEEKENNEP